MELIKNADYLKSENKQLRALISLLKHYQQDYSNADFDIKFVENSVFKDLLDDSFMNKHTCNGTKKLTTQQWVTVLETTLYSRIEK